MKAAWYEEIGPAAQVLKLGSMPEPVPREGEVRVRIMASGVNPSDVKTRAGRPMIAPRIIPHSDGSGVIDQVGQGVSPERVGERVWLWNGQWQRSAGTAAEFITVPSNQAVLLPENTSFAEGACLGIPALTALRALTTDGPVAGQTVLISGGAGAVGAYAIQFARLLGAAVIITTVSSSKKAEMVHQLGADHVINYRDEDTVARIKSITGGRGVDRVVEVDAGSNAKWLPSIIAKDGLVVIYGSSTPQVSFDFGPMIISGAVVRFFIVYELSESVRRQCVSALNAYLDAGLLNHLVAASYQLDEVAQAHQAVESGQLIGNVVIELG